MEYEKFSSTVAAPVVRPALDDKPDEAEPYGAGGPWIVILYNVDWHPMDEVADAVASATGYPLQRAVAIMLEAHTRGRAIAFTGSCQDCERVAGLLRAIRLQVETDAF